MNVYPASYIYNNNIYVHIYIDSTKPSSPALSEQSDLRNEDQDGKEEEKPPSETGLFIMHFMHLN